MKRDKNGVVLPVKISYPAAEIPSVKTKEEEIEPKTAAKPKCKSKKKRLPIGEEDIAEARKTLNVYMASKKLYDERFKNNYNEYNLLYTENADKQFVKDEEGNKREVLIPKRQGAQALNVIMNKHADAMDNYPEIICLPRSADDEQTAKILNAVIPCIHKRSGFLKVYSDVMLDKFVGGCGVYSVVWDKTKDNGLGDVQISRADILQLFWEPHIENIQDSSNFFCVKLYDIDGVKKIYPELENETADTLGLTEYDTFDNESKNVGKVSIVDWYYKKCSQLHLCKFVGNHILYSSENDGKPHYNHGLYPFVFEPMFKLRDTPVGFGFMDVVRAPQRQLDDLKVDILTNVKVNSQPRTIVNDSSGINESDFTDLTKTMVKVNGDPRNITFPIETKDLAGGALSVYDRLIDEIKETSATNDASNGASAAGVTSGSAIAALQEAGGKVSRDSNKLSQETTTEIAILEIELMRQFYTLPRFFRITGDEGDTRYINFDNSGLMKQPLTYADGDGNVVPYTDENGDVLQRLPIFDIDVKAQKASPFATAAQNEMMMNLFNMGVFNPEAADAAIIMLDGMTFEGKEKLIEKLRENKTLLQTVQELSKKLTMMQAMMASKNAMTVQKGSTATESVLPQSEASIASINEMAGTV